MRRPARCRSDVAEHLLAQTLKSKASQGALPMPAPLDEMLVSFFENVEAERAAVALCKSNRAANERQQSRAEKAMADFGRAQDSSLWTPCVSSHAFEPAGGRRRSSFRCSSAGATRRSAYHARDLFSRGWKFTARGGRKVGRDFAPKCAQVEA